MTTATTERHTQAEIDETIFAIGVLLCERGLNRQTLPSTATEPAEEVGFAVEYDDRDGDIVLSTTHETVARFLFHRSTYRQVEDWIDAYQMQAISF